MYIFFIIHACKPAEDGVTKWNKDLRSHICSPTVRSKADLTLWNSGKEEFVGASMLEAHGANTKKGERHVRTSPLYWGLRD